MFSWKRTLASVLVLAAVWGAPGPARGQYPQDRYGHTTTLLPDGSILVAGGVGAGGAWRGLERFYPASNTAAAVPIGDALGGGGVAWVSRASHTATLMPNGKVLIAGGITPTGITNSVQFYDPVSKQLMDVGGGLAVPRVNHTSTLLPNGLVLIAGGNTTGGAETASCELYSSNVGGLWADRFLDNCGGIARGAQVMTLARAAHAATLLSDGRVLVSGGYTGTSTDYAVATEFFDYRQGVDSPASGKWVPGPALIAKRALHTATQMGNGKVLIVGGMNDKNEEENLGYLETVEVYDPVTNRVTPASKMEARKAYHASVMAGDGRVQVYGGLGNITTTYMRGNLNLNNNAQISIAASGVRLPGSSINPNPALTVLPIHLQNVQMSSPVSGRIVKGRIDFSSPTLQLNDAVVAFTTTAPGAYASLDGIDIQGGAIPDATVNLLVTGTVTWVRQNLSSQDNLTLPSLGGVVWKPAFGQNWICFTQGAAAGGSALVDDAANAGCALGGGLYTNQVQVPLTVAMPKTDLWGIVQMGSVRLKSASMSSQANNWMVAFTSGTATMANDGTGDNCIGSQVLADEEGNAYLSCVVTFRGVKGRLNNTGQEAIVQFSTPIGSMNLESVTLSAHYVVSPINVSYLPLSYDVSTITIRQMIFSDEENYSPQGNSWSFGTPSDSPRFGHSSVLLPNADSLTIGGRFCTSIANCAGYNFTPQSGYVGYIPQGGKGGLEVATTDIQTPMSRKRRNLTTTVLPDGKILVAGGSDGPTSIAEAEILDPDTLQWSPAGAMTVGRANHSATLLPNGTVLVAGGFQSAGATGTTNTAEIFYPETRMWVPTSPMFSSRSYHTSTLLPDGNVLVAGGMENGTYLATAEVYHSTTMVWEQIPDMNHATSQHTATLLQDGRVLVAGGISGAVLGSAMLYDPVARTWNNTATSMPTVPVNYRRHSHTATLLRDGRVLVAGGNDGLGEIGRAVIFDPTANGGFGSWYPTGLSPGQDMVIPRLSHSATLLPNGKVLFSGGFKKDGSPVKFLEGFDVDLSTWQLQGQLGTPRGEHASVLGRNGMLLFLGGGNNPSTSLDDGEYAYFSYERDKLTPSPLPRVPTIVSISTPLVNRGEVLTIYGSRLGGAGEASGDGSAGAKSDHGHPRVYLQRLDATGNNGGNSSGFEVDLTSAVYYQRLNLPGGDVSGWQKWSNSSMSFIVPTSPGLLPYGWYHVRVGANSQFSDSQIVLAGPPRPTGTPGVPYGTLTGVSSITWTWAAVPSGPCDGYNVYSATNGIFIGTASAVAVGGMISFVQTGLGPDTSGLIKVSPYTLSGDGSVAVSTVPVYTLSGRVSGLYGAAVDEQSITWSWTRNPGAEKYTVWSTSSNTLLQTVDGGFTSWTQTQLSTNTVYSVRLKALTAAGYGELTEPATAYTKAAAPLPGSPGIQNVSTNSFTAVWGSNTNPPGTNYVVRGVQVSDYDPASPPAPVESSPMMATRLDVPGLEPNVRYQVEVAAVNGDGIATSYTNLGTTATLANRPVGTTATPSSPSTLDLSWDRNWNSASTIFQVVYSSTKDFSSAVSTPIPFSANFKDTHTVLTELYTGDTYYIRVSARNQSGIETVYDWVQAWTDNGGGPLNSIAVLARVNQTAILEASLHEQSPADFRRLVSVKVYPGTFPVDTRVYVATLPWSSAGCSSPGLGSGGYLPAIRLVADPPAQPAVPIEVGISYDNVSVGSLNTLGIVRVEDGGNNCVRLRSSVSQALRLVTAESNHLSVFQLMQLQAASSNADARVFPNPLYTARQGFFTFDRLAAASKIRVFTLLGEEVWQGQANASGVLTWNAQNKAGRPVASGLYVAVVQNGDDKKLMKLAVVR